MDIDAMKSALAQFCNTRESCQACPCSPGINGSCYSSAEYELVRENFERAFLSPTNYGDIPGVGAEDVVNHPSHYTQGGIECIDAMKSAFGADEVAIYSKIAAFKYIWRCEHKNGLEDVKKAVWYLNKYIELKEGGTDDPMSANP